MARKSIKQWGTGWSVARKGFVVVCVPLLIASISLGTVAAGIIVEMREVDSHYHNSVMHDGLDVILKSGMDMGLDFLRYMKSHDSKAFDQFDERILLIKKGMENLESEARGPIEIPAVKKLRGDVDDLVEVASKQKQTMMGDSRLEGLVSGVGLIKRLKRAIEHLQVDVQDIEVELHISGSENPHVLFQDLTKLLYTALTASVLNLVLAGLMLRLFSDGITKRLKVLTENSYRLARAETLHAPLPGTDEIAHLDRVFHDMANALAESAHKQLAVIEHAIDVICSIDGEGYFMAVSPASLQVWGYAPEELIGHKFTEFVVVDDLKSTEHSFRRIIEADSERQPFENRVRKKSGLTVHMLWSAYWATSEQSMFCVAHDITERKMAEDQLKASEARVRSIFESAPVALLVIDEAGTIKLMNPKAENMFGYRMEEIIDKHVSLLLPESTEIEGRNFREEMYESMLGHVREYEARSRSGSVFPIELTLEKYETAEGERYLAAMLDVTERHEMERLKREFVSTVSHELRTPLTAIRGSLTLLSVGALGKLDAQAEKVVKMAERNSLRLISLINDLLDIEKLEAGKLEMVMAPADFQSVMDKSVESVKAFAEQYGVQIVAQSTDANVLADGDRLVQVMVNLLSNAIKYSPRDSTVSVGVAVEQEKNMLRVRVTDQGRGIPTEYKEKIFERFQQVEAEDAKGKGGTGLGLAICKAIVEQHEGAIGIDSEEGKGSTFWFEVPLVPPVSKVSTSDGKADDDRLPSRILTVSPPVHASAGDNDHIDADASPGPEGSDVIKIVQIEKLRDL